MVHSVEKVAFAMHCNLKATHIVPFVLACNAPAYKFNYTAGYMSAIDDDRPAGRDKYTVAQNKIPHQTICNISATSGPILKILEAA